MPTGPGQGGARRRASGDGGGVLLHVALLLLTGLLLRLPVLDLPLGGEAATIATQGERLATGEGSTVPSGPVLMPLLLAPAIGLGANPTAAFRWLDVVLGLSLAPLLLLLGRTLGAPRGTKWAAWLVALHPAVLSGAGGADAGTAGLVGFLVLAALGRLGSPRVGPRRLGAAIAILLPLADPVAAVYLPGLLAYAVLREPRRAVTVLLLAIGLTVVLFTPLPAWGLAGASTPASRLVVFALQWVPVATLAFLLAGLARGVARLGRGPARALLGAWGVGAVLHVFVVLVLPLAPPRLLFGGAALVTAVPVVPLLVLAGSVGLAAAPRRRR
ncbi:MAG: hypothetical protein ACC662_01370, partial [Planctomycetota bacterium]